MTLHLVKLCVGVATAAELKGVMARQGAAQGVGAEFAVTTRSTPTRAAEISGSGSLFWVMKGFVCCRQPILAFEPFVGDDGVKRCAIVLAPHVVDVTPRPRKAFQGWRYLPADEAPTDLAHGDAAGVAEMPESLRRELAGLGLL
jgi:hypothetical protein